MQASGTFRSPTHTLVAYVGEIMVAVAPPTEKGAAFSRWCGSLAALLRGARVECLEGLVGAEQGHAPSFEREREEVNGGDVQGKLLVASGRGDGAGFLMERAAATQQDYRYALGYVVPGAALECGRDGRPVVRVAVGCAAFEFIADLSDAPSTICARARSFGKSHGKRILVYVSIIVACELAWIALVGWRPYVKSYSDSFGTTMSESNRIFFPLMMLEITAVLVLAATVIKAFVYLI